MRILSRHRPLLGPAAIWGWWRLENVRAVSGSGTTWRSRSRALAEALRLLRGVESALGLVELFGDRFVLRIYGVKGSRVLRPLRRSSAPGRASICCGTSDEERHLKLQRHI